MPQDVDYDIYDKLSRKYGMSLEQSKATTQQVKQQAAGVGLDYQFDTMILTNTFDAHRLTLFAGRHGKLREMQERLYRAFFTEGKHIGNHESLCELAVDLGLVREEVNNMLQSADYTEQVRSDQYEAMQVGVRGVPFFLIDGKYAVSGAQSASHFLQVLDKAWHEGS
jgi:predicted DsbA family dithiol-disulfide isomerase